MKSTTALLAIALLASLTATYAADSPARKPNILYIVADDMGYADCGVQGCKDVPTPHLDSIAKQGIRFTDGYVTGTVCSPTRAALMTGRYHYRDGIHDWVPPGRPGLNAGVPTIADYLKTVGYHTGIMGKWHLGEQPENHPLKRGFDEFYGFLGGGRTYFPDKPKAADAKVNLYTQILRGNEPVQLKEYTTIAFAREAAEFIQRRKGGSQPFFLYLAFNAVHTPMDTLDEYLARFPNIEDKKRRAYAAMLAAMDDNIGRVLAAVRDAGFEENTLILFHSDNGGPITRNAPNASMNTPLRGGKGQTWEGGIRVPMFVKWSGHLKPGTYSQPVIQMDLTATILALAGVKPDAKWPMDGANLMPFLEGKEGQPHAMLCWDYQNQWAIRKGQWKLTLAGPEKGEKEPVIALYDLAQDISEKNNLAVQHPDLVKQLQSDWLAWSKEVVVNEPKAPAGPKNKARTP
jgi:arylsulfatase A-like enzyme